MHPINPRSFIDDHLVPVDASPAWVVDQFGRLSDDALRDCIRSIPCNRADVDAVLSELRADIENCRDAVADD
jgi:hypothetical protein